MSTRFRGIPPRELLRLRDIRGGRYPTRARTVSSSDRTGKFSIDPFDDVRTMEFVTASSEQVVYPVLIRRSDVDGGVYDSLIDLTQLTHYVSSSAVRAGISDYFIERPVSSQSYKPYIEDLQHEQGFTSSFYLTGTVETTSGPGFTSPLWSKTQVRRRFYHGDVYTLSANTASIAYYDLSTEQFTLVGDQTNPSDAYADRNTSDEVQAGVPTEDDDALNYAHDARLFGPFGNAVMSGTVDSYNCASSILGHLVSEKFGEQMAEFNMGSVTLNSDFAAVSGSWFELDEVQQPFLIERAVLKLPMQAGAGWLNDTTTIMYAGDGQDVGGPCVTFALMRQSSDSHRELIMSATVIPTGDEFSEIYAAAAGFQEAPHGFTSFSKPTAVISGTDGTFTGSVRMEMTPAVSNGAFAAVLRSAGSPVQFTEARTRMINPFGRAMNRSPSGRSLFGKEFSIPPLDRPAPVINSDASNRIDFFYFEESSPSPYILLPGDRLILSVSKHRSVADDPRSNDTFGGDRTNLTASHDVAVGIGSIELSLYGSLMRTREEFHFGRNDPLTSIATSEALGSDDVPLDQFDVAHRELYSGSLRDQYITGVLAASGGEITSRREVVGSVIGGTATDLWSLQRSIHAVSSDERYYDSLVPNPDQVQVADGAGVWVFNDKTQDVVNMFPVTHLENYDITTLGFISSETADFISNNNINNKWPFAFPFEPRYQDLIRLEEPGERTEAGLRWTRADEAADDANEFSLVDNALLGNRVVLPAGAILRPSLVGTPEFQPGTGDSVAGAQILHVATPAEDNYSGTLPRPEFNKGFYGFGDDRRNQPRFIDERLQEEDITSPDTYVTNSYARKAKIRGWKYGIIDANPRRARAVWRDGSFGQYRDMLEQRPYTRFLTQGTITDGPITVRFTLTDPNDTVSSNISTAATSSMPYFDGEARNRSTLPDTSIVQLDIPDFEP